MRARRTTSPSLSLFVLCVVFISWSFQAQTVFASSSAKGRIVLGLPNHHHLSFLHRKSSTKAPALLGTSSNLSFVTKRYRGGALEQEEEEGDEYDEYDDEEEDDETGVEPLDYEPPTAISTLLNTLTSISKAVMRAFDAAVQSLTSDDEDEEVSLVGKVVKTIQNVITAIFNPGEEEATDENGSKSSSTTTTTKASTATKSQVVEPSTTPDFGSYLSKAYEVTDGRKDATKTPILGGSLVDALKIARSSARLLLVLIPSAKPTKAKADDQAIASCLSQEVAKAAKKKALKKGSETSSFLLWSARAGSSEATQATKMLKVKATSAKGDKRPILAVVYPAQGLAGGVPKIAPKLLAQHHCSPPPGAEAMALWMKGLRKRHAKQYAKMQKEVREAQLYQERKDGYKESVQSDVERKIREKKEEKERLAKEQAEKERLEALEKRRTEFLECLPEEPTSSRDAITLSVRHADGRSEKRKFASDTQLEVLFNWVDAKFKMEREIVVLTTMNGKQTFSWEDKEKTLKEAKLGRMVGLRVSEKKIEEDKEKENKKEEEST